MLGPSVQVPLDLYADVDFYDDGTYDRDLWRGVAIVTGEDLHGFNVYGPAG